MRASSALVLLACAVPAVWAEARAPGHAPGPAARPAAPPHGARLLGTAFHSKGGVGEVVIQTSGDVELEAHGDGTTPVFIVKDCRIVRANDRRPLDTRFFDSPVTGVSVRARGRDLEVSVSLRQPVVATTRKERGPGNTWYWVLSFPPATAARDAAPEHATAANP